MISISRPQEADWQINRSRIRKPNSIGLESEPHLVDLTFGWGKQLDTVPTHGVYIS
jgi:hypothetical protein